MRRKLIIDGNAVYEIDDDCARSKEMQRELIWGRQGSAGQTLTDASGPNEGRRGKWCYQDGNEAERGQDIRFCE